METVLLAVPILLLALLGLALGVIFGRKPLQGSCGGLACSGLACGTCPNRRKETDT
jgi:hypothetical protein